MTARVVTTLDLPARRRLIDRFGPEVAGWCDDLPGLVGSVCGGWRLRVRRALPAGGTSVVFECAAHDGDSVVLKLTPDHRIAAGEAAALATWAGSRHVVRLLDSDLDRGALLLEFLRPGVPLSQDPAGWTLADIAPVLADLWSPRPHPAADVVPHLRERVAFLFDLTQRRLQARPDLGQHLPQELLDRCRRVALALADGGSAGLVHGDLHPGNVLRTGRGPVAIDPRPCFGDRTFDAVDWVLVDADGIREIDRRISWLADHLPGVDQDRVLAWCQATAVLLAAGLLRQDPGDPRAQPLLHVAADTAPSPTDARTPPPHPAPHQ
jgi:streptomycin 6-kinase